MCGNVDTTTHTPSWFRGEPQRRGNPNSPVGLSLCVTTLGSGEALLVARGCMRCVRALPAEALTHSKTSRLLSSSSLLSKGEFETEVEELEGREDNVRERDLSGLFTGDGGVSPLSNRWRKSPATSPSQSAVQRFAAGIVSTTACTASRSRVLRWCSAGRTGKEFPWRAIASRRPALPADCPERKRPRSRP